MLTKHQRLELFIERLERAPPAGSPKEALALLARTLNAVEDEFSGVESNPNSWRNDGRMYPPQEDNSRTVPGHPSLHRYRSVQHHTFIGLNGSIRLDELDGKILLNKPGRDGRKTHELDA